ncbi:hypothetical protein Mapa_011378 [Marchantia paleacea]|nr:hypothetical protein Mapa_011378 [Marchantia paleacea]
MTLGIFRGFRILSTAWRWKFPNHKTRNAISTDSVFSAIFQFQNRLQCVSHMSTRIMSCEEFLSTKTLPRSLLVSLNLNRRFSSAFYKILKVRPL